MKLREEILFEHSKAQCEKIVKWIGASQNRFDELFALFLKDEYRISQRAAWPLGYCSISHPKFIKNKIGILLSNLSNPRIHGSVKRNTMRILEKIEVPQKYHGLIINICCQYITDPKEAVAVKAYSLTVLHKYSLLYPELLNEAKLLVQDFGIDKPSFKVRAAKLKSE